MLENPRNKEFDVYVLDEVFPENEHGEFLKLIRELNGDWKKRIDDLDVFWFDWKEVSKLVLPFHYYNHSNVLHNQDL